MTSYYSPVSIIPITTTQTTKMQRRRSFDGSSVQMDNNSRSTKLKPTPTPLSSVSARVTSPIPSVRTPPNVRGGIVVPKINTTSVPFPRGGRQIGTSSNNTERTIRRSASIERRGVVEGIVCVNLDGVERIFNFYYNNLQIIHPRRGHYFDLVKKRVSIPVKKGKEKSLTMS